ncbi:DUF6529 family protein [Actinophytocola sp.]|uniref:DUF6529 family protein n=1 Tax=Actinophytocola sp. TaxID=1872138 RepID=UPI002D5E8E46|nr:DUF6529 family protein [Actinophytocola sp.]HYQ68532.1 DUF6529 family protein [Actinophytocola sp.]
MTLPPDFGPTGKPPDNDYTEVNQFPNDFVDLDPPTTRSAQADLTQPVPHQWTSVAAPAATTVPPLAFDDDDPERNRGVGGVVAALAIGALVAVALGVYGKMHEPTGEALNLAGFSSGIAAKAWLGSIAFVLAIAQVLSAMAMWGRLPGFTAGHGTAVVHRWSGRIAVIVSLPVAAHCLYALGFQDFNTRVLVHSLFGCFFYGLFVCKMVVLTRHRTPGWVLPVVGAAVFTGLVGLWVTSSLWFFSEYGVSF